MDANAIAGNKLVHQENEGDRAAAAALQQKKTLQKILARKKKALHKMQATLSFANTVTSAPQDHPDKAVATQTATACTQTSINQKEGFIRCKAEATQGLPPKQAVRDDIGTLVENLGRVANLGVEGDTKAIRNKGSLPTDCQNSLNLYTAIQGGNVNMRQVCGGGGKFNLLTFTVNIRCPKRMNVAEELDSAYIDLTDNDLNFKLKIIKFAHNKKNLVALMTML